jgi:hypothetical protein
LLSKIEAGNDKLLKTNENDGEEISSEIESMHGDTKHLSKRTDRHMTENRRAYQPQTAQLDGQKKTLWQTH